VSANQPDRRGRSHAGCRLHIEDPHEAATAAQNAADQPAADVPDAADQAAADVPNIAADINAVE
jgi:hypothetical protein